MQKPEVSVVIPTYNRGGMVMRALDSVYSQALSASEVIVVDDGSTDSTVAQIQYKYPEVILIQQTNHGVSHARNMGIEAASGQWIAFLDSDDMWYPGKLETQLAYLKQNRQIRICHSDEIWIRNGRRVNPMRKHQKYGGHIFQHCLPRCVISPSSVIIHRSIFSLYGAFDERLPVCEDYDLWLRITANEPVSYISEALLEKYGGHSDQLSQSTWGIDRYRIFSIEKLLLETNLSTIQENHALKELVIKLEIYLAGARRRRKLKEAEEYQTKVNYYRGILASKAAHGSDTNTSNGSILGCA